MVWGRVGETSGCLGEWTGTTQDATNRVTGGADDCAPGSEALAYVRDSAVVASSNMSETAEVVPPADGGLLSLFRERRTAALTPAAQGPTTTTTAEATITRTSDRIIINAGAGNDQINVTRDAATGGVTVSINGETHTFTGADADRLTIRAGDGNDRITVASDVTVRLTLEGGRGNDRIRGGGGNDTIRGGSGNDRIEGGAGDDTVSGGAGRDYINGSLGNDTLRGDTGNDVLYGGDGNDTLEGGLGTDYLEGSRGNDTLRGGAGSDVVSGGIGDDTLQGDAGNDVLYAGQGRDTINGGTGTNRTYSQAEDTVRATRGGTNRVINVELVGNPGGTAVHIVGSPEFVERVEADLEMLRSSPIGRRMMAAFDASGRTVTIEEIPDDNGYADWSRRTTGGPHPFLDAAGNPGTPDDATIGYNPSFNQMPNRRPGQTWKDIDPVVVLYHEMVHSYNIVTGTFQDDNYTGPGADNGVANNERQAVGLPNTGVRWDHDGDDADNDGFKDSDPSRRATPRRRGNPNGFTENAIRDEMNRPRRPTYDVS
jgi:Ca2+-binding RTX toxin-like protein